MRGRQPLQILTQSHEGFSALTELGKQVEYSSISAKCIASIIYAASGSPANSTNVQALLPCAVPAFLNAVAFALKIILSSKGNLTGVTSFMHQVFTLLHNLEDDGAYIVANHPATTDMRNMLRVGIDSTEEKASLIFELEGIQQWSDRDDVPLRGLRLLFSSGVDKVSTSYKSIV